MGIIQKQAIRGTIYSYIGVGVGFITTVLIYPKIFSTDQVGLLRIIVAYSTLFGQFATLGFTRVTTMLFPYFRNNESRHHGFNFINMMVSLTGLLLALTLLFTFKPLILGNDKSVLLEQYFYTIIPLTIFTLFYLVFDNYYKALYNSVQGTFLKEFLQRVVILIIALLFLFNLIDFRTYVLLFIVAFFIPALALLILLMGEKQFSLRPEKAFVSKKFRKRMINVSFYGILTSFSGILVLNIDSIMINGIMDLGNTGIYAITFFFGTVILVPSRSLLKISSVIIADSWKAEDFSTINDIYYKSCLNQLIVAALLFVGIWGNVHNLFNQYLLPPEYEAGKYVILFISLSSVIQMAGGTSNMILFTSPRYKTHSWLMLMLISLLVVSNLIFIPILGITGAALASALSFLVFNFIKFRYLKKTFGFKPYDLKFLWVILIAGGIYGLSLLFPHLKNIFLDIGIRSLLIFILYSFTIYFTRISQDINGRIDHVLRSFGLKNKN